MRLNKDLSQEKIIEAAIRFDYLPSDFDMTENAMQLAIEQQGLLGEQPINPLTGQPIPPPVPPPQLQVAALGGQPGQPNGGGQRPPASNRPPPGNKPSSSGL